ncbi:NUDIX domain-containing protein [Sphingosinicella sp. CPCC 101087]|uniref:NUDIX domain-containing protein n=1 Tax=Sphingosinicella sp. CPCC 101087 TaxID=2497754 RepID=UPI00101BCA7A|nr:NUDIX domain-containing protein [Sphingosinicella sp. CPCC 101087]
MPQTSAGILMWRRRGEVVEVLLAHFGGPMWQGRDAGAWGIPKGLVEPGEDLAACARREFEEELGVRAQGELVSLGRIRQKGGKLVEAFALQGDFDPHQIVSNHFTMEWPPRSGQYRSYAEVDRAEWMDLETARAKILASQGPLLDRLEERFCGNV